MRLVDLDLTTANDTVEITEDSHIIARFKSRKSSPLKKELIFLHKTPHLKSRIDIRSVVYRRASFDLSAKLVIEKSASDTDSYLKIDTLLAEPDAKARAVPSLEIKTDNVKAGHGATIGSINTEWLYYLQSRGISTGKGKSLIVKSFLR